MKGLPLVLLAWLALAGGQDPVPAPGGAETMPDRAVFGVLRRDGLLTPFALLRGRRWTMPWPMGFRGRELPINLEAVPEHWWGGRAPGVEWRAWLGDNRVRPLTLGAPTQYFVHCSRRIGIRTDYKSGQPLPPGPVEPFPKDALVVSEPGVNLQQVEVVPRESEAWASLALSLLEELDRAEDLSIGAIATQSGWRHPVRRQDRRRLPVRLESWYRTPLPGGQTASFIEAVRSYEPGPEDEGCGLETFFSGWVFHPAEGRIRTSLLAKVTYCDRVGAMYMLPFGALRFDDRVHWIYQLSGWEDEWYVVTDVGTRSARNLVEYYAGGRGCG